MFWSRNFLAWKSYLEHAQRRFFSDDVLAICLHQRASAPMRGGVRNSGFASVILLDHSRPAKSNSLVVQFRHPESDTNWASEVGGFCRTCVFRAVPESGGLIRSLLVSYHTTRI